MSKSLNSKTSWLALLSLLASSQAFAFGGVATIVFNPDTNMWGSSHGQSSRADAENAALSFCGQACAGVDAYALEAGSSALRETWATNGWVAYAHGYENKHFGTSGAHDSQYDAEASALANCGGQANNCYVVRSLSSFVNADDVNGTTNANH